CLSWSESTRHGCCPSIRPPRRSGRVERDGRADRPRPRGGGGPGARVPTRAAVMLLLCGHHGKALCAAFAPQGCRLATGHKDGTVELWDTASGTLAAALPAHQADVTSLTFSPKGKVLASGSLDRTVKLWDAATGQERAALPHRLPVHAVAFQPGGKLLAAAATEQIYLWNVAAAPCQDTAGRGWWGGGWPFAPDGQVLAMTGVWYVPFWEMAARRFVPASANLRAITRSPVFAPDGGTLAVPAGWSVYLWDVAVRRWR